MGDGNSNIRVSQTEPHSFDLVVCGGGMAGVCCAIGAARLGLKVALVQDRPVLGGNSSSEVRVRIHGAGTYWPWAAETGVIAELLDEERYRNPQPANIDSANSIWDLVLYEWVHREKTLELFLNTSVRGVEMETPAPNGIIRTILCSQLGTEKEFALAAPLFCDATGDGSVAALAGAAFRYGRESRQEFGEPTAPLEADHVTQGATMQFKTVDVGRPVPFHPPDWAAKYPNDEALYWRPHDDPRAGYWWIEIGYPFHTIRDNEKIRHELLSHILGVFDHLKNHGQHGADNLALDWIGMVPGKRESRRVMGPAILTENDLRSRRLFDDRVAYGGWFLDEHVPGGLLAKNEKPERTLNNLDEKDKHLVAPYSIPLSSLYSKDIHNLFLAGRDISATHMALSSARVMATCAVMGQAVGGAASVCRRAGSVPRHLAPEDLVRLQQVLLKQDCYIPRLSNSDSSDLALRARVSAQSAWQLTLPFGGAWLELALPTAQVIPLTADSLTSVELYLENRTGEPRNLRLVLRCCTDIWDLSGEGDIVAEAVATLPNAVAGWQRFNLNATVKPGMYWLALDECPGVFWGQHPVPPPGTAVATLRKSGLWRFEGRRGEWKAQAVGLDPPSNPFRPENVINGITRPEVAANLWISDPGQKLPQSLTLKLPCMEAISEVRLIFDNNLGRMVRSTPGNFIAPELVKDYSIDLYTSGSWQQIVNETGNRHRHRIHTFEPHQADKVRISVHATNGMPMARIYEVRIYTS